MNLFIFNENIFQTWLIYKSYIMVSSLKHFTATQRKRLSTFLDPSLTQEFQIILDFFHDFAGTRLLSVKRTTITAFALIFNDFSQRDVIEIFGFSAGLVSDHLNRLVTTGTIQKKQKSITEPIRYSHTINFAQFLQMFAQKYVQMQIAQAEQIRGYVQQLQLDFESNLAGRKELFQNLSAVNEFLAVSQVVLQHFFLQQPLEKDATFQTILKIHKQSVQKFKASIGRDQKFYELINCAHWDPSIQTIESQVIPIIRNSQFVIYDTKSVKQIMPFFYTRKNLSQKQLRILTGLSKGAVSQALKLLRKKKIIHQTFLDSGSRYYTLFPLIEVMTNLIVNASQNVVRWKGKLQSLSHQLTTMAQENAMVKGLNCLREALKGLLKIMPFYQETSTFFQELREQIKKSENERAPII